jgi:diamine N-acetyltransferase
MNSAFDIRVATLEDADSIGTIGPAIYAETYGHMWTDLRSYVRHLSSFGVAAVRSFMCRADTRAWIAETEGTAVGFLTMVVGSPDPVEGLTTGAEVPRIYILPQARGCGLGERMADEAEEFASSSGADHLWLDAMKSAPWAWRTYLKWGFREIGSAEFASGIGAAHRPMVVMRRDIARPTT